MEHGLILPGAADIINSTQTVEATERAKDSHLTTYVGFVDECTINEVLFFVYKLLRPTRFRIFRCYSQLHEGKVVKVHGDTQ